MSSLGSFEGKGWVGEGVYDPNMYMYIHTDADTHTCTAADGYDLVYVHVHVCTYMSACRPEPHLTHSAIYSTDQTLT